MADTLRENVAVITGASEGIGGELALQLAERGAWLVLAARGAAKLHAMAEEVPRARRPRALAVPTDVAEHEQCIRLVDRAVQEYGRIDTLVNNAGVSM